MKTIKPLMAGIALATGLFSTSLIHAQQNAVSIVFTGNQELRSVDTVIAAGDASLDQLLNQYTLSRNDVQIIDIDLTSMPTGSTMEVKHVSVLHTEEVERNDETGEEVRVIRIERSAANEDQMQDEEREIVVQQMEIAEEHRKSHKQQRELIEVKKEADMEGEEHLDVRIERKEENGKTTVVAWVNGEEVSEEEAQRLMEEHATEIDLEEHMEMARVKQMEAESEAQHAYSTQRRVAVFSSGEPKQAIVIVKKVSPASTGNAAQSAEGNLSVYPNPAKEIAKVKFDGKVNGSYELNVTNLAGQTVWSQRDQGSGTLLQKIDTRDFAPGTYIVSLTHDNGIHTQKLVVK